MLGGRLVSERPPPPPLLPAGLTPATVSLLLMRSCHPSASLQRIVPQTGHVLVRVGRPTLPREWCHCLTAWVAAKPSGDALDSCVASKSGFAAGEASTFLHW